MEKEMILSRLEVGATVGMRMRDVYTNELRPGFVTGRVVTIMPPFGSGFKNTSAPEGVMASDMVFLDMGEQDGLSGYAIDFIDSVLVIAEA